MKFLSSINKKQLLTLCFFCLICIHQIAFADAFSDIETKGQSILIKAFDLIKWIGLALGIVYGGMNGLKLFSDREDKMDVMKKIAWIPFAILILFGIPGIIKIVTGENPLE